LKEQVTLTSQLKEQEQVTLTEQIPSHEQDSLNTQILEQDKDSSNTQIQNKEITNDAAEDNEINGKKKEASFEDSLVSDLNTVEKGKTCENETLLQTSYSIPALPLLLCCPLLKSSFCLLSSSSDESNCPSLILEASI
jgi:hypothetical protein